MEHNKKNIYDNMDKRTFIDKVKTLFSEVEDNVETKYVDVTTIDGVTLRIKEEEIKEGVEVYVVSEEGEETLAPEGDHTVDGKIITTDAEGKIVEIKDTAEDVEEEATKDEEKKEETEMEVEETEEEVKAEEEVNPLEARIEALEKAIVNLSESMSAIDLIEEKLTAIANLPADEEVKLSKMDSNKKLKLKTKEDKLRFLSKRK